MKFPLTFFFYILGLLFLINCSSDAQEERFKNEKQEEDLIIPAEVENLEDLSIISDTMGSHNIRFTKVATFKDAESPHPDSIYIGNMSIFDVDSFGKVYIAAGGSRSQQSIHIYNPDGSYYKKIGRKGRGPCEFIRLSNIEVQSSNLYAYDEVLNRISVFSLEKLECIDQVTFRLQSWQQNPRLTNYRISGNYYPRNDGRILMAFQQPSRLLSNLGENKESEIKKKRFTRYYLVNPSGEVDSSEVFEQEDLIFGKSAVLGFEEDNLPHTRNPLITVAADGTIYAASAGKFLIKVYSPSGVYQEALYYSYDNKELDHKRIISKYAESSIRSKVALNADYPATWPALDNILVDDEKRLWVSTITKSDSTFNWWVISEEKKLLARFNWMGEKLNRGVQGLSRVLRIKNSHLYAYEVPKDSKYAGDIVKYKISFKKR